MRQTPSYDDKVAYITDFMTKLPVGKQKEILEETSDEWTIQKQADYLYDRIINARPRMEL
jgi:hypothetical protein